MDKVLIFDMDGTIADLYGIENWEKRLRNEDAGPYREAPPLYSMEALNILLSVFKKMDFRIAVVSWGAMDASREYGREIRKAKLDWLREHEFPYDEVHIVKYGTPKQKFIKDTDFFSVLIDDNAGIRNSFLKSKLGQEKKAINPTQDIFEELINLLVD